MNKKKTEPKIKKVNWFIVILFVVVTWSILGVVFPMSDYTNADTIPLTEVLDKAKNNEVQKITIDGNKLKVELKDGKKVVSSKEPQISFFEILSMQGIDPASIEGGIDEKKSLQWLDIVSALILPIGTLFFLWWIFRQVGKGAGNPFSLGKSTAKLFSSSSKKKIGFKDVAGAEEVKNELIEIVDFLKKPEKYRKLGARIPRGVLLIGPAGVGKTLLARAVAGEANVPFYSVAGSEFIEMIVGVGSARVRDLFKTAKQSSPSLVFIDEIDAIGRHRGRGAMSSNDEREQTLNQILVEMDGFDQRTNVIILAATNRPDMLDPALIRPGRFDRHIRLDFPDVSEREAIIQLHMKGKPFASDVDIKTLAKRTVGFSGADLENMLNESAILAARKDQIEITAKDLSEASTKVKLGPARKTLQTEKERKVIAYHEAGHTVVGYMSSALGDVSRVSIVSRAMSLGHTEHFDDGNRNETKSKLLARISSLLGGRVAEELVFKEETVGAHNDIQRATYLARLMVTDFGMSSLGPINYISENKGMMTGDVEGKAFGYSDEISKKIDLEVRKIIEGQYKDSKKILVKYRKALDELVLALLEKETLEQDEIESVLSKYK